MIMKKLLLGAGACALALAGVGAGLALNANDAFETKAETVTTVYYAVPNSEVGTYSVKLNINRKGDGDDWASYTMTKESYTYNGWSVYSGTYTDLYNGVGTMQIQLYNGESFVRQQQPISSWTAVETYNGKVYVHNTGWNTASWDDSYIYYVSASDATTTDKFKVGVNSDSIAVIGADVTGVINFEGSYKKIYKIPVSSTREANFTFINAAGDVESSSRAIVGGSAYWWTGTANGDAGLAIDLLTSIESARNSAASYESHSTSICGINEGMAASLYGNYEDLEKNSEALRMFNSSTTKTYLGKDSLGNYNWSESISIKFSDMIGEIYKIALRDPTFASEHGASKIAPVGTANNEYILPVIIAAATSMLAIGGFFLIRRRKEN